MPHLLVLQASCRMTHLVNVCCCALNNKLAKVLAIVLNSAAGLQPVQFRSAAHNSEDPL
jgi:hypothetical protein